jgi:hypothetical protein
MIYVGNTRRHVPGLGDDTTAVVPAPAAATGLFASGLDLTGWGLMEWAIVAAIAYFAWKLVGDVKGGVRAVRGAGAKRKRKAKRRAELQEQLSKL